MALRLGEMIGTPDRAEPTVGRLYQLGVTEPEKMERVFKVYRDAYNGNPSKLEVLVRKAGKIHDSQTAQILNNLTRGQQLQKRKEEGLV